MKSGNLNFLEPSGPLRACNGTDLPLLLLLLRPDLTFAVWRYEFSGPFFQCQQRYSWLHNCCSCKSVLNYLPVATKLTLLVCSVTCMNFQENPWNGTADSWEVTYFCFPLQSEVLTETWMGCYVTLFASYALCLHSMDGGYVICFKPQLKFVMVIWHYLYYVDVNNLLT